MKKMKKMIVVLSIMVLVYFIISSNPIIKIMTFSKGVVKV